jgi:hypothetical protein
VASIAEDQARGIRVTRKPWPGNGPAGDRVTFGEMASRILEGSRTPSIRGLAGQILRDAGSPEGDSARVSALRDYMFKTVLYAPDPPLTEMIQAATVTLCTPDGKLCVPIGDCDDLTVALASLIGACGLEVRILALDYGPGIQPHVLLEFRGARGGWTTVDPSPPYTPVGYRPRAQKYTVIDPFDPQHTPTSSPDGEFVGVGATATAPSAIAYQNVTLPGTAHTGLRYRLGLVLMYDEEPTEGYRLDQETRSLFHTRGWNVESISPQGPAQPVPGTSQYMQAMIVQGIAEQEIDLTSDTTITYLVVGVQATSATPAAPDAPIVAAPPATPAPLNLSITTGAAIALGVGAVAGTIWYLARTRHAREAA